MEKDSNYLNKNIEVGDLLLTMASCYRYLGSENRLKAVEYTSAARTVHALNIDIAGFADRPDGLSQLKGIGGKIAMEIVAYLKTGKIKTFEKLKKHVPLGLLDLMDVIGFGPATIKTIHEQLHVNNREEMIKAVLSNRLASIEGFGYKKIENIKRGLKLFKESRPLVPLFNAVPVGMDLLKQLRALPGVQEAVVAGSLRRKKETIADIDIIVMAPRRYWEEIIQTFCDLPFINKVIVAGGKRISVLIEKYNLQVDIHLVNKYEYGAALLYFTGSKEHNIQLQTRAEKKGVRLEEYGVFETDTDKPVPVTTEGDIYRLLALEYIPPEIREGRGEIEIAGKHHLPQLIEEKEIRSDMQVHSYWSNGEQDIETIARYLNNIYPQYEYIIITDYLSRKPEEGGLKPEEFVEQFAEIDLVNKLMGRPFIKKGIDVPILKDGSPGVPDNLLQQFEWVTASIVSGLGEDNTARLMKACENPYVHCLNHPGGRLIGKREPWTVNWKKLIDKAASTGTALAINAQPDQLDLNDVWVKAAIEKGVKICIGTDACDLNQFDYMSTGVSVARRGWCTKENILNTRSWKEIELYKQYKQSISTIINEHIKQ